MQRLELTGYGKLDAVVRLAQAAQPDVAERDVRIKVLAASINPIDFKFAQGALRQIIPLRFPAAFGFDACGTIDAIGAGVSGFSIGDRVYCRAHRNRMGAFAEYLVADVTLVAKAPEALDAFQAAAIPLVALTTRQALVERAQARPGQHVLIHAGSGGLGSFAIQYAKRVLGLHVSTTTSSGNADWVAALGADRVYHYDREDYRRDGAQFDIVFDTLGGNATRDAFKVLKHGGTVVSVAGPPDRAFARALGAGPLLALSLWMMSRMTYLRAWRRGARYFRFLTESSGAQLDLLREEIETTGIRPVIDRVYPLAQGLAALAYVASGRAKGKVVLDVAANKKGAT